MSKHTSPRIGIGIVCDVDGGSTRELYSIKGFGSGYVERDWDKNPLGYCAPVFDIPLLTEDEAWDMFAERETYRTTNRDMAELMKLVSRSQGRTSSCWAYAGAQAQRWAEGVDSGIVPDICPTSVIYWLLGRDQGYWSTGYVEACQEHGWCTAAEWQLNDFSGKANTPENRDKAKTRRQIEFVELPSRGLSKSQKRRTMLTALLTLGPVAAGYNRMAHAITLMDGVIVNGAKKGFAHNSGLYRDKDGFTIFDDWIFEYDDAIVPTVMRRAT